MTKMSSKVGLGSRVKMLTGLFEFSYNAPFGTFAVINKVVTCVVMYPAVYYDLKLLDGTVIPMVYAHHVTTWPADEYPQ